MPWSVSPEHHSCPLNGGDLGDDPFGGGWNSWNIGVKSWEVKRAIVQPAGDKIPLYICGEAYSDAQGWVEGALQTTERMLAKLRYPLAVRRRLTGDIRRGGDASAIARASQQLGSDGAGAARHRLLKCVGATSEPDQRLFRASSGRRSIALPNLSRAGKKLWLSWKNTEL